MKANGKEGNGMKANGKEGNGMKANILWYKSHSRLLRVTVLMALMLIALLAAGSGSALDASELRHGDTPVITIEANRDEYVAGLGRLVFTLTRGGDAASGLDVTVEIEQDEAWLTDTSLPVAFAAGDSEATLTLLGDNFSRSVTQSGNLTAAVASVPRHHVDEAHTTVRVISQEGPAVRVSIDRDAFSLPEDAGEVKVGLVAHSAPGVPYGELLVVSVTTKQLETEGGASAVPPNDYRVLSEVVRFAPEDFHEKEGRLVRRSEVTVSIVEDRIHEGDEQFGLELAFAPGLPSAVGLVGPDGELCSAICAPLPITIVDNDPEPILTLTVSSNRIEERGGTGSTVTVFSADGSTFGDDRVITIAFNGPATPGEDFTIAPADSNEASGHQLVLTKEHASVDLVLTAVDDGLPDPGEWVLIGASLGLDDAPADAGQVIVIDNNEPNELDGATPIAVGLEHEIVGTLTEEDNGSDVYSFYAVAGNRYIIEMKVPLAYLDEDGHVLLGGARTVPGYLLDVSILEVLYRNGTQVLGEHDRGGFTLNFARAFFTPGFDGIFQIVVGAGEQDRSALGSYTLSVRVDDFADDYETGSTTVLTPSTTAFARIDSDVHPADPRLNSWDWIGVGDEASPRRGIESLDDRDVFRIEIAEAGDYVINVSSQTTRAGIWFVWDYQGNLYNRVESRPVESIVIRFSPGTYYVEIGTPYESFGNTGRYTVSLLATDVEEPARVAPEPGVSEVTGA